MGRHTFFIALVAVLAVTLVTPSWSDAPRHNPSDHQTEREDVQYIWDGGLLRADCKDGIEGLLSKVDTFVRSVVTVVKAVANAIHTVVGAVAKVLINAAVKVAMVVGQWLLQWMLS